MYLFKVSAAKLHIEAPQDIKYKNRKGLHAFLKVGFLKEVPYIISVH